MAKLNKAMLNKLNTTESNVISFYVDGKKLDVTIKSRLNEGDTENFIAEMLLMYEFLNKNNKYKALLSDDENDVYKLLVLLLSTKNITDLPFDKKESVEETFLELINVSSVLSNKKTDSGETIFSTVISCIDPKIIDNVTIAVNEAISIVNTKIGGLDATI